MEPLRPCEGLNGDILRRPTIRETQLFQAVDGDPSAEITLDARLTQLSVHEKNRCVLFRQSVGLRGGDSSRAPGSAGTIAGTVLGTARFPQL